MFGAGDVVGLRITDLFSYGWSPEEETGRVGGRHLQTLAEANREILETRSRLESVQNPAAGRGGD